MVVYQIPMVDSERDDLEEGGAFDTHESALKTVLSLSPEMHHIISHGADVLHHIITSHDTTDHHQLGHLIRDALQKRGVVVQRGGSFWSWLGHGVKKAWDGTKKFVSKNAKSLGKIALDGLGAAGSAAATAFGQPELIPVIEGAASLGKKAIGGALPTSHLVGALKDVASAHCPHSKANLIHKDFLMHKEGKPSPILTALHFAHESAPFMKAALLGGEPVID